MQSVGAESLSAQTHTQEALLPFCLAIVDNGDCKQRIWGNVSVVIFTASLTFYSGCSEDAEDVYRSARKTKCWCFGILFCYCVRAESVLWITWVNFQSCVIKDYRNYQTNACAYASWPSLLCGHNVFFNNIDCHEKQWQVIDGALGEEYYGYNQL